MSYSTIVILLAAVSFVLAAHIPTVSRHIPIVSQVDTRDASGQLSTLYKSADGTVVEERGILKRNLDGTDYVLVKSGSYSYLSPEGIPIKLTYTADETGFHPISDSIPV